MAPQSLSLSSYLRLILDRERISRSLLYACLPALVLYTVSLLILQRTGFGTMEILRDPAQLSGASSFLGFLSNVGVWIWVSAAAIALFGALTRGADSSVRHRELLALLGAFSMILAIDDFFMIHDRYVSQSIVYPLYAIVALALMLRHHRPIVQINGFAFLFAVFLLGASTFIDTIQSICR